MPNSSHLIGRQPILNRNEEIVAYELLFRSAGSNNAADFSDASQASASVIINTLSAFGLDHILGPHLGFVNLDLELLMSDSIQILPKERVVLELLETLQVTPELVERCRQLKDEGFILALDDHEFDQDYAELYDIVGIIKVDLFQSPIDSLAKMVEKFRKYPVKLLAEKVETREEYLRCRDMGFEYFQGYYFAKPSVMEKKRFDDSGTSLLKLMRLLSEDAEIGKIEQAFRDSPGLTYKLLMLVNSVSLGVRMKINNVRHAVATLGRQQIKRWVQLALFASEGEAGLENPLVEMAAVRAAFMEHLAEYIPDLRGNVDAADQAFMTGILSLLENIYNVKTTEIVANLNLSDEIGGALTNRAGKFGKLLSLAELFENLEFKEATAQFEALGLTQEMVMTAQVKAYNWRGEMR